MAKVYNWRAVTDYRSDTDLSYGVTPSGQTSWQTSESGGTRAGTYTYWYRDSNTAWQGQFQDALSSKVEIELTQAWITSVDNNNNLTVTVYTTINSIIRTDIEHPTGYYDSDLPGRDIDLYQREGDQAVWSGTDNQIATAHTILQGPIQLATETFTIAPGDMSVVRPSMYLHNQTVGMSSYDDVWLGIQFRNPLPPSYIPGKIWNGSDWLSHNRATNGHAKQYNGSAWGNDMETVDGGTASGDPPEIWHSSSSKKNMRKIGTGA